MVQFRKHLNTIHKDIADEPEENVKVVASVNDEHKTLEYKMELLKLEMKLELIKEQRAEKENERTVLRRAVKPSLYLDEMNDVIPIERFDGTIFENDLFGLRNIIDNRYRNIVLNKGFVSAVVEILEEARQNYGGQSHFPIACVDKVRKKLFFFVKGKGWVEDDSHNGYLHKVICKISQYLSYFNPENDDDVRWQKNKENWLLLINKCFAWDFVESDEYCKKRLITACCDLLFINDIIKQVE
jgi:hypothetical protein